MPPAITRRLDIILSHACRCILMLMPVLFVVGHVAAIGEISNSETGWKFDPRFDLISTYACRSSAGWVMTACMVGMAFVLGFISWHAAKNGPGFFAWFTAVVAAVGMVNLLEVAWHPMKPSHEVLDRIKVEVNEAALKEGGLENLLRGNESWYHKSLRSFLLHAEASDSAQRMILFAMVGTLFLWRGKVRHSMHWLRLHQMALAWLVVAALGSVYLPRYPGIYQRVAYIGVYFWMRIVVREIERGRGADESESRCVVFPKESDEAKNHLISLT